MGGTDVLHEWTLQFEELTPTKVLKPTSKLRLLAIDWLFSDIDFTKGRKDT